MAATFPNSHTHTHTHMFNNHAHCHAFMHACTHELMHPWTHTTQGHSRARIKTHIIVLLEVIISSSTNLDSSALSFFTSKQDPSNTNNNLHY